MTAPAGVTDTQRRVRGHAFLPPAVVRRRTPGLGATETTPCPDKLVLAHYFTGGWDWYVVEADWTTGQAFALTRSPACPDGEWGYVDLAELEAVRPRGSYTPTGATEGLVGTGMLSWVVERDCWWTPCLVSAIRP